MSDVTPTLDENAIICACLARFPRLQAIYIFGSFATGQASHQSDADIALLLPPLDATAQKPSLWLDPLRTTLEGLIGTDVDLLNLRQQPVVLQKEVVATGRRISCAEPLEADLFEISVLSGYQKLNEERAEILGAFAKDGRAYDV